MRFFLMSASLVIVYINEIRQQACADLSPEYPHIDESPALQLACELVGRGHLSRVKSKQTTCPKGH